MNVIEIDRLVHRFADGFEALAGIDLRVPEGAFVVIAGRNGSGKTTLLRHLNALLLPTEGEVRVAGVSTARDPAGARRVVGMVFQDSESQIVGETVADDVAFGPENLGLAAARIDRRVRRALEAVDMAGLGRRHPHTLSGGEKRRLAVAGVLAMEPRVVVFDEPFDSLDYPGVRRILRQIVDFHRGGQTVIVTTHDIEKVIAHAERLVVMDRGRVVLDGPPGTVMAAVEDYGVRQPCASRFGLEVGSWLH